METIFLSMTETVYIQSATTLLQQCTYIDQIIKGLYDLQIARIGNADVDEYKIDDGQMKIETKYRSAEAIEKAIFAYDRQKQTILNRLNGRNMVLRDAGGLR